MRRIVMAGALMTSLIGTATAKDMIASAGQPFCTERENLQEFILALVQQDDRWLAELKDKCMGLAEGTKISIIEEFESASDIGHVVKVRAFAPRKGSIVGYTLNLGLQ